MKTPNRIAPLLIGLLIAAALGGGVIYAGFAMQNSSSNGLAEATPGLPYAPTPERPSEQPADVTTIFVGPELKDCEGMGPMECLQIADSAAGPWSNWYSGIEGFTHQPGLLSELKVRRIEIANPPADGSSLQLVLVEVVAQTPVAAAEGGLDGTSWNLVSIDSAPAVAGGREAGLSFTGAQVGGSSGCNRLFGSYAASGAALSFSQVGATKMACSPELNAQELAFFAALEQAESYTIADGTLTISFDGGKQMVFSAA
jgi:heat shock protein HslJ